MTSIAEQFNSPRAFQMALNSAAKDSPRGVMALDDHVRHRFLARVFSSPTEPWVLKGGTAILARVRDTRATKDVDLMRKEGDLEEAMSALRRACALDLGDMLTFSAQASTVMSGRQPNVDGYRVSISVTFGTRTLNSLKVDLVVGSLMTGEPEQITIRPPHPIEGLDLDVPMRLYPAADHVADKVCATAELRRGKQSSRVKDLVDIVVLASSTEFRLSALQTAIHAEWVHRGLNDSPSFNPPPDWAKTYGKSAKEVSWLGPMRDFETASRFAATFLSPALARKEQSMRWDMTSWTSE